MFETNYEYEFLIRKYRLEKFDAGGLL